MPFLVDIRYVLPPLINLTLWGFIIPLGKHWAQDPNFNIDIFFMACESLFLAISILLIFLFTFVRLPLPVGTVLQFRAGHFPAPLTLSFLASIIFPSPLFWSAFLMLLMLVILSPFYEILFQATTAPTTTHITGQRPDQVELERIAVEA